MPVIAYLDAGIYCHPIVDGLVDAVKIGYYNPPDMPPRAARASTASPASWSSACPGSPAPRSRDVEDVDQCDYDLVADDDFVLGAVPGFANGVRRRRLARHRLQVRALGGPGARRARTGRGTVDDLDRFAPARFDQRKETDEPSVTADLGAASL